MKKFLLIVLFVCISLSIMGQNIFEKPNFSLNPNYKLGGIFDSNIVKMNHSMSFMSGVSSTGDGFYQSAYTNHLNFHLRENLKLNVDVSVLNIGTMNHNNDMKFSSNNDNQNVVVPSVSLHYKPSERSTIYFEYRQIKGHQLHHPRNNDWWY